MDAVRLSASVDPVTLPDGREAALVVVDLGLEDFTPLVIEAERV